MLKNVINIIICCAFIVFSSCSFAAVPEYYNPQTHFAKECVDVLDSSMSYDLRKARLIELLTSGNIFSSLALEKIDKTRYLRNMEEIQKWLKISANNNVLSVLRELADKDQYAQALMGEVCQSGLAGMHVNNDMALEWHSRSAKQGNRYAKYSLGILYLNTDDKISWKWTMEAALQGSVRAKFGVGFQSLYGQGAQKDPQLGIANIASAAIDGYAPAQRHLGHSIGTADPKSFAGWMRKAAAQGDISAQITIAQMYTDGFGVDKDDRIAKEWYKKAAAQGSKKAQQALEGKLTTREKFTDTMKEWGFFE